MRNSKIFRAFMVGAVIAGFSGQAFAIEDLQRVAPAHHYLSLVNADSEQKRVDGAKNFIGSMAQRGISFLGDDALTAEQRAAEFEKLLNDSFDMKTLARFSLGRYWRVSTAEQRAEYLSLFKKMVVTVYSARFSEYDGQTIEVREARPDGTTDVIVTSHLVSGNGPDVRIDWRVRYKDGRYKIIDVIVEGVSMAVTQRSDFASVIQRGGGEVGVLLAHLKQ